MIDFELFRKRVPLVRQAEAAECGLACLAMISAYHGAEFSLSELRRDHGISLQGSNLGQLLDIGIKLNLEPRALRCELEDLQHLELPAILHWDFNHFVVLEKVSGDHARILDPAIGSVSVDKRELSHKFTGVVLELLPSKSFRQKSKTHELKLSRLIPISKQILGGMMKVFILSIVVQFTVLMGPLFLRSVIDEAIVRSDFSLLMLLVISFAVVKIIESAAILVRSLVLQFVSAIVSFQMEAGLLRHLMGLPLTYFQRRQIGDIQQRFFALQSIQQLIVNTSIATIIDLFLMVFVMILLFFLNAELAAICLAAIMLMLMVRLAAVNYQQKLSMSNMLNDADKQSQFLETLRGIQLIKATGIENRRNAIWKKFAVRTVSSRVKLGNTDILLSWAESVTLGASTILIIYFGASSVLNGALTVGTLVAFLAYKTLLEQHAREVLRVYTDFRMLDVNLERVADIALEESEVVTRSSPFRPSGVIKVEQLEFAYGPREPRVIKDASFEIGRGDFVSFVGTSGSGKTTLLKLLIGLIEPVSGRIVFDASIMNASQYRQARRHIGMVLQDDRLLTGTIAQNISLFGGAADQERVENAAGLAAIADEIQKMPMKYDTLVGDMGTALSGGQVQRIMLARALYSDPSILVMDEGTSNLDVATERMVNENLKGLNITRIIAAHRPETISSADRIFEVKDAIVTEVTSSFDLNKVSNIG